MLTCQLIGRMKKKKCAINLIGHIIEKNVLKIACKQPNWIKSAVISAQLVL